MVIKNNLLGGTNYTTPTARVKPTDLNETNDAIINSSAGFLEHDGVGGSTTIAITPAEGLLINNGIMIMVTFQANSDGTSAGTILAKVGETGFLLNVANSPLTVVGGATSQAGSERVGGTACFFHTPTDTEITNGFDVEITATNASGGTTNILQVTILKL